MTATRPHTVRSPLAEAVIPAAGLGTGDTGIRLTDALRERDSATSGGAAR